MVLKDEEEEEEAPAPPNVDPPQENSYGVKCTLCLSWMMRGERIQALACGHTFHQDCVSNNLAARPALTLETVCPFRCHLHSTAAAWEQQCLDPTGTELAAVRTRRATAKGLAKGKAKAKAKPKALRRLRAMPTDPAPASSVPPAAAPASSVPPTLATLFNAAQSNAQRLVQVIVFHLFS